MHYTNATHIFSAYDDHDPNATPTNAGPYQDLGQWNPAQESSCSSDEKDTSALVPEVMVRGPNQRLGNKVGNGAMGSELEMHDRL